MGDGSGSWLGQNGVDTPESRSLGCNPSNEEEAW
jgi:hypothetical protein